MGYQKTNWANNVTSLNKTNMDNIEAGIEATHKGIHVYGSSSVGSDAYAITFSTPYTAYNTGMIINFKADVGNTGAATLNIDGLGAKDIKKMTTAGKAALETGDIIANGIYTLIYDGTDFILCAPTAILANLLTAQGDMLYASGVNTPTRLALGASGKAVCSNGTNPVYDYPDPGAYTASDTVILTANTEHTTESLTYVTVKTFTLKFAGTVRVKGQIKSTNVSANVYVALDGVQKATTTSTTYVDFSFDVSVVPYTTYLIQLKSPAGTGYPGYICNVTICADKSSAYANSITD
jgi:hypothetical protein